MATVRDICEGALRKISVASNQDPAAAEDIDIALDAFNAIMDEHVLQGWISTHTTQALTDTFALDGAYDDPMKSLLAMRIAGSFDRAPSESVRSSARLFLAQLANAALTASTAGQKFERPLWDYRPGQVFVDS